MSSPRLLTCLLFAACALPLSARPAHKVPSKDPRAQIADLEQQWRTATLNADVKTLESLLSDDFVGISFSGQVNTKATQIARLRDHALVVTKLDLSGTRVKVVGAVAIVTCHAEIDATNDGAPMRGAFLYTRIYQRLAGSTWKITNFEATRIRPNERNRHHPDQVSAAMPAPPAL